MQHHYLYQPNMVGLKSTPDNHFHAIVTDGPYGLRFMGKKWDYDVPGVDVWREALRTLRPGGYLLAFAGARTYHRVAVNIEDAGFEIRDQIMWLYGSGFPKSLNVGKAIDKESDAKREIIGEKYSVPNIRSGSYNQVNKTSTRDRLTVHETAPATDEAKMFDGWGTGLKPAHEPVVVARKPLSEKNVAKNVLRWGTGAVNIDGGRVPFENDADQQESTDKNRHADFNSHDGIRVKSKGIYSGDKRPPVNYQAGKGRYPANVIHDGSPEVLAHFPQSIGMSGGGAKDRNKKQNWTVQEFNRKPVNPDWVRGDTGSAARFFYCAKASAKERNAGLPKGITNTHPTIKPISLMRYLVRLVTPPGGHVCDLYAGTNTTGIACIIEGFEYTGWEYNEEYPEYHQIGKYRTHYWAAQQGLFTHEIIFTGDGKN